MIFSAALLIATLTLPTPAAAQAEVGEFRFQNFVSRQEGDEVIYIVSDLRFRSDKARLTGDYAVLWLDAARYAQLFGRGGEGEKLHRGPIAPPSRGKLPPASATTLLGPASAGGKQEEFSLPQDLVREIFVEGTVFFEQGQERLLEGARLYMDLASGRALIEDGRLRSLRSDYHGTVIPLSVKASWFRREATGRFVADDAKYTTCSYGNPHQHIESEQVWIEEGEAGTSVDAYRSTFRAGDLPVFYLPRTLLDPETKDMLLFRGASLGTSSSFGFFALTKWGHRFHEIGEDFHEAIFGERLPFRGDWELSIDYRRKRGYGFGPQLEWESPKLYRGRAKGYFANEQGEDVNFYSNSIIQEEGDRARFHLQNRIWLNEEWTFDTELAYASDPAFLPEYFRRDYFKDKEPETDAYLRWTRNNQFFSALVAAPLNDFEPVSATGFLPPTGGPAFEAPALKESLPELRHEWLREPIAALPLPAGTGEFSSLPLSLYYTEKSSAGYLRRHPSQGIEFEPGTISFLPAQTLASARFDTLHELSAPFHAGPVILTPFLERRYTAYSADATSDETSRVIGSSGVRATTHFAGALGETWTHLIDPSLAYENVSTVTRDSSELIAFDETDAIAKSELLIVSLRNRLARRPEPAEKKPGAKAARASEPSWYFPFDIDLRLPVYLDPDRDNAGKRYGDLETDIFFQTNIESGPLRNLRGFGEIGSSVREPGPALHRMNFAEAYLAADPTDRLGVFVRHRRYRTLAGGAILNTGLGGGFTYRVSDKWMILGFENYNFELRESDSHGFTLRRFGHDWVFEFTTAFNDATSEKVFSVNFQPVQLFRRGKQMGGLSGLLNASFAGQQFYTE